MGNTQGDFEAEQERLEETIDLAKYRLCQARKSNEETRSAILSAKKELRENTSHSISNLWSSEGFEALAELNQYVNPVMDKIADYEEVEHKIQILEELINTPYFARIDFQFEDEDSKEEIYIGRASLKKANSQEMTVYDWRSPIASVFYRFMMGSAFYDAPGGRIHGMVHLKRQYEIEKGVLKYFFDADVQIVDEFLRRLLSQNTSSKMKTIIETIQKEQDIVIRDMENDLMMVQGVAGSGKTSIALHRAAYLMYRGVTGRLLANDIIIISPNTLFEQYISEVLPLLGEEHVVSVVFEELLGEIIPQNHIQSRNQFLENLITGSSHRGLMKYSMEFKTSQRFLLLLEAFIQDLPYHVIPFEDVWYQGKCIVKEAALRKKVMGRIETPLGIKLNQLEDYILEVISTWKGVRIFGEEELSIRKELQSFTVLDIPKLYRSLFEDKEYFCSLMKDTPWEDSMDLLLEYTRENLDSQLLHYEDAIALAYMHLRIHGNDRYGNIRQVVIDEAQDFYPLQYEIFRLLFSNSKFTVLGDINQTLEKEEDCSLYEGIKAILKKKNTSLITMDKSFRCTNEILRYSLQFIEQQPEIKSFNRKGEIPRIHWAPGEDALRDEIRREVNKCLELGYGSVALICKSEKNARLLYTHLKDYIRLRLIENEGTTELQGVFVIPVYMSKGLEFDAVLICDADGENYSTRDDKKLLYIACTRALHRLQLFCEREPFQL